MYLNDEDRKYELTPTWAELQKRGRRCGTLIVFPSMALLDDLSVKNHFTAQVYEKAIMAYLKMRGGSCTIWDLYNESCGGLGLENDLAIGIAVHSLRNKGCIKTADPYGDSPMFMDQHKIQFVTYLEQTCPRSILPRWCVTVETIIRHELSKFRREMFGVS